MADITETAGQLKFLRRIAFQKFCECSQTLPKKTVVCTNAQLMRFAVCRKNAAKSWLSNVITEAPAYLYTATASVRQWTGFGYRNCKLFEKATLHQFQHVQNFKLNTRKARSVHLLYCRRLVVKSYITTFKMSCKMRIQKPLKVTSICKVHHAFSAHTIIYCHVCRNSPVWLRAAELSDVQA